MIEKLKQVKRSDNNTQENYKLIEIIILKHCIPSQNNTLKPISNLYDPTIK